MIDAKAWTKRLRGELRRIFGDRLLFVGLQGSHRRGEATEASDIDAVVILDRVDLADLDLYRDVVAAMPEAEKACGFIGGRDEIAAWPAHDLFQFVRDTEPIQGDLWALAGPVSREDVAAAAAIGAANLYHALCHAHVHGDEGAGMEALRGACKGSFFILQALHFLRAGEYAGGKRELLAKLDGPEREILAASLDWERAAEAGYAHMFTLLLEWSKGVIAGTT